jgi:hypothetical protein
VYENIESVPKAGRTEEASTEFVEAEEGPDEEGKDTLSNRLSLPGLKDNQQLQNVLPLKRMHAQITAVGQSSSDDDDSVEAAEDEAEKLLEVNAKKRSYVRAVRAAEDFSEASSHSPIDCKYLLAGLTPAQAELLKTTEADVRAYEDYEASLSVAGVPVPAAVELAVGQNAPIRQHALKEA